MNTIAKDINSLLDLFQKDKSAIDEIVAANPASYLARVLQLRNENQNSNLYSEKVRDSAIYSGNSRWFEFLLYQISAKHNETTDHFAVTIPEESFPPVEEKIEQIDHSNNPVEEAEKPIPNSEELSAEIEVEQQEGHGIGVHSTELESETFGEVNSEENANQVDTFQSEAQKEIREEVEVPIEESVETHETVQSEPEVENVPQEMSNAEVYSAETESEISREENREEVVPTVDTTHSEMHVEERGEVEVPTEEPVIEKQKTTASEPVVEEKESGIETSVEQEASITFEPLHTIDYFASQGIKLSEGDLANDRLSQQVKSFTGWLKSMKKLHPGKLPEQDEVIQQIIQNAAEVSNVESDVLTEAMAEVLVKQNKKEKAVEMFEKLSLMNPSKSAYFAAKIESIKTS